MGWKNVKEHYRIGHIVHVREGKICIGSAYISDLIAIGFDGIVKKYENFRNDDLERYALEMSADHKTLMELIRSPDKFDKSISVYTYDGGEIIEKQCEALGWPNVTHDGCLMYEDQFSADKKVVVEHARRNARAGIELITESIEEIERQLTDKRKKLHKIISELKKLESDYPESVG